MPVIFNEPLSFLQRLAEYMEHTFLVHRANGCQDSVERMKVGTPTPQTLLTLLTLRCDWCLHFLCLLLAVRGRVCGVGRGVAVGAYGQTLQPTAGGNL